MICVLYNFSSEKCKVIHEFISDIVQEISWGQKQYKKAVGFLLLKQFRNHNRKNSFRNISISYLTKTHSFI